MFFDLLVFDELFFFCRDLFEEFGGGFVVGILGDEFAHDGELEDGLFEVVDGRLGGEEEVEVGFDALPGLLELGRVAGGGEGIEQGFDERLVGVDAVFLLLLKLVTQRHQLIHLGHDPVLLGEGWERDKKLS